MYEDKELVCEDCGKTFIFSAGDQEFYAEKGFQNEPKRCKECRHARKEAKRNSTEYFETTCAKCGGVARVKFQPREDKPVYCSECLAKMKEENAENA